MRLKEFLSIRGIDFVSVNVLEDPTGMAELEQLGVRSVPVLSRGDKYTFGQSTKQIVEFLGLGEKSGPELSTDELAARVTKFMDAALELIPLMPADRLATHVPGRPRSYRTLAFHLFRVVQAFLDANENVTLVQAMFREEPAADATTEALVAYGAKIRDRFRAWWQAGDTAPSKTLQTYYGPQTLHELMERTTWHSGQHVRQYMMLLEKEGVSHHRPLVAADFAKLPMPQNVWDG
ncbi:glutaredoxin domain-containing protein [Reyranella soli]|uniref:glutaredoxin domain-containing protein n=1 Tax=Reyranella soli TaxID=1230389 RepID=UPI0011BE60E8|nr:DinB family protein [Reyranella soli]